MVRTLSESIRFQTPETSRDFFWLFWARSCSCVPGSGSYKVLKVRKKVSEVWDICESLANSKNNLWRLKSQKVHNILKINGLPLAQKTIHISDTNKSNAFKSTASHLFQCKPQNKNGNAGVLNATLNCDGHAIPKLSSKQFRNGPTCHIAKRRQSQTGHSYLFTNKHQKIMKLVHTKLLYIFSLATTEPMLSNQATHLVCEQSKDVEICDNAKTRYKNDEQRWERFENAHENACQSR